MPLQLPGSGSARAFRLGRALGGSLRSNAARKSLARGRVMPAMLDGLEVLVIETVERWGDKQTPAWAWD